MGVLKKAAIPFLERSLGRPLHKPTVYFRVTPFCNLKCIICDDWKPEKHKERRLLENMLTKDEYIKIIDDLADFGVQRLQFGGGEPLVRKEIFDIINYAKSKGLPTRILTNGYLLSKMDVAKKLSEGIDEVWVSLDGPNPETHDLERGVKGCFENVVKGIENLNDIRFNGDRKFKIVVAAHISPMNMFDPEEYLNLLQKLKADSVLFTPVYSGHYGETLFNTGIKTAEDVRKVSEMVKRVKAVYCKSKIPIQTLFLSLNVALEYYRNPAILRKFKCYIGGYGLGFIETNGDVFPCTAYTKPMGNVRERPFSEIWNSQQAKDVRKKIKCLECGGCFHLQAQKNHLYNLRTLISHRKDLMPTIKYIKGAYGD